MTTPEDETAFAADVQAMLRQRAEDISPEAMAGDLPDAATVPRTFDDDGPGRWRLTRRRTLAVAAACLVVLLGLATLAVGSDRDPGQTVKADRSTEHTDPTEPARDGSDLTSKGSDDGTDVSPGDGTADPSDGGATGSGGPVGSSPDGGAHGSSPGDRTDPTTPGSAPGGADDPDRPGGPGPSAPAVPVVTMPSSNRDAIPSPVRARDCDGTERTMGTDGKLTLSRNGATDRILAVDIVVTGSLAGAVELHGSGQSGRRRVTVELLSEATDFTFRIDAPRGGDVTFTAQPGAGYALGDVVSRTFTLPPTPMGVDCLREVPVVGSGTVTVTAGHHLERAFSLPQAAPAGITPEQWQKSSLEPDWGARPPGVDVGWDLDPKRITLRGTPTTPGTYRVPVRHVVRNGPPQATVMPTYIGTTWLTVIVRAP